MLFAVLVTAQATRMTILLKNCRIRNLIRRSRKETICQMIDTNKSVLPPDLDSITRDTVERFIRAFQQKDASVIAELVAEECIMETMQPAPDGERIEGYDANVRFWEAMV